jgi:hypothetical protein
MDSQWRNLSLVFALAAVVATPALGQAVAPKVGPAGSYEEGVASVPDFSGIWVHSIPGFEPLPSGPTALVNRSRRENGTGDILKLNGDYTNPILKPEASSRGIWSNSHQQVWARRLIPVCGALRDSRN